MNTVLAGHGGTTLPAWWRVLATAIVFGLAAYFAVGLTRQSGYIAAVWPATGVLLAAVMMARPREIPAFLAAAFVANIVANVANGHSFVIAAFLSACGTAEITCAILLMRFYRPGDWMHLEQPRVLVGFLLTVCLVSPLVSATPAAFGLHYFVGVPVEGVFGTWWTANALGLALMTPPLLILFRDGPKNSFAAIKGTGALISLLLLTAVTAMVFYQSRYPFIFMVFPPIAMVAFYADFLGVAIGLLLVAMVSSTMSIIGSGPLALIPGVTPIEKILTLQVFLATLLVMGFPIAASLSERRRFQRQLEVLATTDTLTGLATRRRFDDHFHTTWGEALRVGEPVAVMMLDIDFFKPYNDDYGHLRGDECITAVARIVKGAAQRPLDLAVRFGGEEFLLLLPHTSIEGAQQLATDIHQRLAEASIPHRGSPYERVTISIGIAALVPHAEIKASSLIEAADTALFAAKRGGRSRTEVTT